MPRTPRKRTAAAKTTAERGQVDDDIVVEPVASSLTPDGTPFPRSLPLLPIRDQVYFPHMIFPLLVGREKSVRALEEALSADRHIVLVAQRLVGTEDPSPEELYSVGIAAEVMQILRVPDGTVRVMLEGVERAQILHYLQDSPYYRVVVQPLPSEERKDLEIEALMRGVTAQFEQIVNVGKHIPPEALINVVNTEEPGRLVDTIAPYLHQLRVEAKQELLETVDVRERLEKLAVVLKREWEILEIQKIIRGRVEKEMGDTQREMILREQLKAIQQELGERDERAGEIEEYRARIAAAAMPPTVEERAAKELDRLEKMPYASPEGVVIRNYLDWLTSLPWTTQTEDVVDVEEAAQVLDADHYGLRKAKERILEFLAVRRLAGDAMKGPILCFVGPPGVGKTSIGRSIARALNRKFVRVSLGGVRDEAEIRGHRRTYVGALPGRIIQGIKQAGARNPVFMLDEIDKLGMDFRGDPSSALLEALDPEQNGEFSDHYLEVPFNLRDVMFITTANLLDPVPPALRDRMEVISFAGYTEEEKLAIATRFLVPKQVRENGLRDEQIRITEGALRKLIREYTREAGVRNLEREIATLCRKVARRVAGGHEALSVVDEAEVVAGLGPGRHHYGTMEERDEVGAATGLVYTEFGGDIVTIEVSPMRGGDGQLVLTGQLGDVMKESARAALSCVRSRAGELGLDPDFHRHLDIHIHVPAGAVPKDGPSAGITLAAALASALTGRAVRKDIAMTGEITLRGRVLPVGGVKEKVLAAHRAGIRTVVLPEENRKDLEDVPDNVRQEMTFRHVERVDEVLDLVLLPAAAAQTLEPAGGKR
ncbi:MAG: endopeptidase La [Chthonomonadales bacterium]|nr:endopeptidase La [Chthonomonadales bacterium]